MQAATAAARNDCFVEGTALMRERFVLVTLFGSTVCVGGLLNNALLLFIFLRRLNWRSSHIFYLVFLAAFDVCVATTYLLLFPADNLYDVLQSVALYRFWHWHVRATAALAHFSLTASTYMLVAASIDRFTVTVCWTSRNLTQRQRVAGVAVALAVALVVKGGKYFELSLQYYPGCTGFASVHLDRSDLAKNRAYNLYYVFWLRHVFHVFLPFCLLLVLNAVILCRMRRSVAMRGALAQLTFGRQEARKRRSRLRAATRLLAAIVASYLVANMLNVAITVCEHMDMDWLAALYDGSFYTLASDASSLLTIACSAVRLPIYYACNKQIRDQLKLVVGRRPAADGVQSADSADDGPPYGVNPRRDRADSSRRPYGRFDSISLSSIAVKLYKT